MLQYSTIIVSKATRMRVIISTHTTMVTACKYARYSREIRYPIVRA